MNVESGSFSTLESQYRAAAQRGWTITKLLDVARRSRPGVRAELDASGGMSGNECLRTHFRSFLESYYVCYIRVC